MVCVSISNGTGNCTKRHQSAHLSAVYDYMAFVLCIYFSVASTVNTYRMLIQLISMYKSLKCILNLLELAWNLSNFQHRGHSKIIHNMRNYTCAYDMIRFTISRHKFTWSVAGKIWLSLELKLKKYKNWIMLKFLPKKQKSKVFVFLEF